MTRANLKRLDEGKLYYSISEVCSMTGLEQHVLRYWESEFPQLRPKKNRSGNRAYRSKEIKIIRYIRTLLYEEMYTIPGAKKKMADANMADIEGQQVLLRVPPTPLHIPQMVEMPAPVIQSNLNGTSEDGHASVEVQVIVDTAEIEKLRAELVRVKGELQVVLKILNGSGR